MLLTTKKSVTTVEEIPFEVPTPFFSKMNEYGVWNYYAIEEENEGASVVHLYLGEGYRHLTVTKSSHSHFGGIVDKAIKGEPITETEFLRAISQLIPASKELIDL